MRTKERQRQYNLQYYKNRRKNLIELLGGKCAMCGSTENLEFDHIDSSTKTLKMAQQLTVNKETIVNELSKCQILCKKCHIKKTKICGDANIKLKPKDVENIRKDYAFTNKKVYDLASAYNIGESTVRAILHGLRWNEIATNDGLQNAIDSKCYINRKIGLSKRHKSKT